LFATHGVSASTLRTIAAALRSRQLAPPFSSFSLASVVACPASLASELNRLAGEGLAAAHLALLIDAAADTAEARLMAESATELVWTGPEAAVSMSRDTAVVVEELFASARRSVLVSTFAIHQAGTVFAPLAARQEGVPDLQVRLFVHVERSWKDTRVESELLREFADNLRKQWPGTGLPDVYYDPRTLSTDAAQRASWHAKCLLVDDEVAFVTSANFTEWAQQRNVEAGVLVRSPHFTRQLRAQFDALVQAKAVRRLPGF
jgi:phosphatidylserine/phosphatidylglycerophosphate/cardiolipin synthase-like enzyme